MTDKRVAPTWTHEIVALARLAMARDPGAAERWITRLVRKYRTAEPAVALALGEVLSHARTTRVSPGGPDVSGVGERGATARCGKSEHEGGEP